MGVLFHFSEDPTIKRFVPHVPRTNPEHPPAVWAIDAEHAPLYWFPRDCPRIAMWPRTPDEHGRFGASMVTEAARVHAIELAWLDRMRTAQLYRYEFDSTDFKPWAPATGQWTSQQEIEPVSVSPVGELFAAHVDASIELRAVPSLWPLHNVAMGGEWEFSIVRMSNAQPRALPAR